MTRRAIVHDADTRRQFEEARQEGHAAAPAVAGVYRDELEEDLDTIERLLERGHKVDALRLASQAMRMSEAELFSLLPAQTGASLWGYVNGLVEGSRGQGFLPDPPELSRRRSLYG